MQNYIFSQRKQNNSVAKFASTIFFPGEVIQMGRFKIDVPVECISDLKKAYIKITLRYEDGGKDDILVSANPQSDFIIYGKKDIEEYIKKDHLDFNLLEIL